MTKVYAVDMGFMATGHTSEDALEEHLDAVMEHLLELDGIIDPSMVATLATGEAVITVNVEAEDPPEALRKAISLVRTAVHACNGDTAGWEDKIRWLEQTVRPSDLVGA